MELYKQIYEYPSNYPLNTKEELNTLASYIRQLDIENSKLLLILIFTYNYYNVGNVDINNLYDIKQYGNGVLFNLESLPNNLLLLISRFLHFISN